jgi:transcriptional activator for dhaKLM operon
MARDEAGLAAAFKSQRQLIQIATPYLEDVYQFIEGSGCAIMLADGTGCVLNALGDRPMVDRLRALDLGIGSYWAEIYLGTNAFGLALVTAMPTQVVGAEHFLESLHGFASSAAPIHHVSGRIVGVLGIVSPAVAATSHTLSLAMGVSRAITNQLHTDVYLEETNYYLSEVRAILEAISVGVITCDSRGHISHINTQAAMILGANTSLLVGESLASLFESPHTPDGTGASAEPLDDIEASFHMQGKDIQVVASLRPILDGARIPKGFIILFRPLEEVRQLVYRQVGADAALTFDGIPAGSPAMQSLVRQARIAARGTAPVLLQGEGGVGKGHLARAIHNEGQVVHRPFITVDCRAIPHELMISEFLGYEQSDHHSRPSKFELANGGTLLIDQIGSMSLEMQHALLHIIETDEVTRLGSSRPTRVRVRIVATTNEDLERLINKGHFLADLYFRFGVFNLHVPPLRQRPEDIPLLVASFLEGITRRARLGEIVAIEDEAMAVMCRYPWPGNVRELESALERAFYQCYDDVIRTADLPEAVRQGRVMVNTSFTPQPVISLADAEREAILRAGWACKGQVGDMAQQLGIGRTSLWRKMKQMNLTPAYFKR